MRLRSSDATLLSRPNSTTLKGTDVKTSKQLVLLRAIFGKRYQRVVAGAGMSLIEEAERTTWLLGGNTNIPASTFVRIRRG